MPLTGTLGQMQPEGVVRRGGEGGGEEGEGRRSASPLPRPTRLAPRLQLTVQIFTLVSFSKKGTMRKQ